MTWFKSVDGPADIGRSVQWARPVLTLPSSGIDLVHDLVETPNAGVADHLAAGVDLVPAFRATPELDRQSEGLTGVPGRQTEEAASPTASVLLASGGGPDPNLSPFPTGGWGTIVRFVNGEHPLTVARRGGREGDPTAAPSLRFGLAPGGDERPRAAPLTSVVPPGRRTRPDVEVDGPRAFRTNAHGPCTLSLFNGGVPSWDVHGIAR